MMVRSPGPRGRIQRAARAGFTFLDIVIVVLLMGLISAVAVPRYVASMEQFQLRAAVERVAGDITWGRQVAKQRGAPLEVVFSLDEQSYRLPGIPDPHRPGSEFEVVLTTLPYAADLDGLTLGPDGTADRLVFDLYGRPDAAGQVVIRVGRLTSTIVIDGTTGHVSVMP